MNQGDEHDRWHLYLRKLESGEDLREAVVVEPDPHVAVSLVLRAFEVIPAADRQSWLDALPAGNQDYAARRLAELAMLEALDPETVVEFDDWTDWLQLRVAETFAPGMLLEALGANGRTKRIRRIARSRFRESLLQLHPGVTFVDRSDLVEIERKARRLGVLIYHLTTPGPDHREDFFDCVRADFPQDPILVSSRSWDALVDSVRNGLHESPEARFAVLWPDSSGMREHAPDEFETAVIVLDQIAGSLADPRWGRTRVFSVFVGR